MATNKNALIRYKILDSCFRNSGKKYYIEDLIKECENSLFEIFPETDGISLRQIRDDIAFMKSSEGWSIELGNFRDGKKMYYRYKDTSFSINNMPLNDIEITHLQSAFNILSQFKGMPQFEWMNELLPKLKYGITQQKSLPTIIEFDSNRYLKGIEHLGLLYNAIYYKKALDISYQPFENDKPFEITIHPYFLKQYNNRWFLLGYNPENGKYDWNLALDRIVHIKEITASYIENNEIDWDEYFEDIIGVTKPVDKKLEKIILHFLGSTGNYIKSKPLHGSQKVTEINENTIEVKLELIINYEFERLILSYADSVKVIFPDSLQSTIKDRLLSANKLYMTNHSG